MGEEIRTGYLRSGYGKGASEMKHVTVAIAVVGIVCISFLAQAASAATPAISVEPSWQKVLHGDEFTVNITIVPAGNEVVGADYILRFNNTLLNATSLVNGTFFSVFTTDDTHGEGINNTKGTIDYCEVIWPHTGTGVTTNGTLSTITFQAIGEHGVDELYFKEVTLSNSSGYEIPNVCDNNGSVEIAQPTSQTWYLTPETKPGDAPNANDNLTHAKNNLLHKGAGSGTGTYFNLNSSKVVWFYADTGAECGIGFGNNPWEAHIRTEAIEDDEVGHNLMVEICRLNGSTGNVTVIANHTEQLTAVGTKHLWNITCEDNESSTQDFSTGDWLAVRLSWDCDTDELQIYYKAESGSDSYIESPASDPGYPIPEFTTLVLLSSGLIVLAGYVLLKRKDE